MKHCGFILILVLICLSTFSCSTFFKRSVPYSKTVESDLFPKNISRSHYYQNIGIGYSENGDSDKASEYFRLAVLHEPNNIEAKMRLSDEYRKQHVDFLAEVQLLEIIKLQPSHHQAMHKLAELYLHQHIYSKAQNVYTELIQQNPTDLKALWATYFIEKTQEHYAKAESKLSDVEKLMGPRMAVELEKASLLGSQNLPTLQEQLLVQLYDTKSHTLPLVQALSDAYFKSNKWGKAFTVLQRFSDTNDFQFPISEKLSYAAIQVQNYDVALSEYDKQKKANPDSSILDLKIAHGYFLMENYAQAQNYYLKSIKMDPQPETFYYLSKVYQMQNQFDRSENYLQQIEPQSEYYGVAQIELANIEKPKDFQKALSQLAEAHVQRPDIIEITKSYADMLIADRQFPEAIVVLEDGIIANPDDEDLRLKIAYTFYQADNKKSFEEQMTEAVKINPANSEIYSALAQLWFVKNRKSSEVEFFATKAIELKSKNINLKPLLAWALLDQNKSAQAIALFEAFYEQNPGEYFYAKSLADVYRYAYINSKADQFSKIALSLQSTANLTDLLQNRSTKKLSDFDTDQALNSRVPASLQDY